MSVRDKWVRRFTVDETAKHANGFTIYKITSVLFPLESPEAVTVVSVWKRYSDVQRLHKSMRSLHTGLHLRGTFPTLAKSSFFKRFQQDIIEERAKSIKTLLEFVAEHRLLFASTDFVNFLQTGYPEPEPRSSVIAAIRSSLHLPLEETPPLEYQTSDDDSRSPARSARSAQQTPEAARCSLDVSRIPIYEAADVELRRSPAASAGSSESLGSLPADLEPLADSAPRRRPLPDLISFDEPDGRRGAPSLSRAECATRTEDSYVFEAGYLLNVAARCEDAGDYQRAFDYYKSGIEKMLVGVQTDGSAERRALVKQKTTKYLSYAEQIYNRHLCGADLDRADPDRTDHTVSVGGRGRGRGRAGGGGARRGAVGGAAVDGGAAVRGAGAVPRAGRAGRARRARAAPRRPRLLRHEGDREDPQQRDGVGRAAGRAPPRAAHRHPLHGAAARARGDGAPLLPDPVVRAGQAAVRLHQGLRALGAAHAGPRGQPGERVRRAPEPGGRGERQRGRGRRAGRAAGRRQRERAAARPHAGLVGGRPGRQLAAAAARRGPRARRDRRARRPRPGLPRRFARESRPPPGGGPLASGRLAGLHAAAERAAGRAAAVRRVQVGRRDPHGAGEPAQLRRRLQGPEPGQHPAGRARPGDPDVLRALPRRRHGAAGGGPRAALRAALRGARAVGGRERRVATAARAGARGRLLELRRHHVRAAVRPAAVPLARRVHQPHAAAAAARPARGRRVAAHAAADVLAGGAAGRGGRGRDQAAPVLPPRGLARRVPRLARARLSCGLDVVRWKRNRHLPTKLMLVIHHEYFVSYTN